jgi:hypothetical protein
MTKFKKKPAHSSRRISNTCLCRNDGLDNRTVLSAVLGIWISETNSIESWRKKLLVHSTAALRYCRCCTGVCLHCNVDYRRQQLIQICGAVVIQQRCQLHATMSALYAVTQSAIACYFIAYIFLFVRFRTQALNGPCSRERSALSPCISACVQFVQ